ncbi:hypothetical protein [Stenotrophomonas sp. PFBMAA-4]|uniref:hypothetical protein n=1 Tax=Stenotrophomonas sp. PFBMAA-4 TaxID=3043301 RepID=UPI0024B52B58|nr:hypothetical protein [Stenotrophomonas sp. PFBMAA-4]MDI9273143.1 hypothetical protein [Stenotrophomonas sp. PFBMAA-4]
MKIDLIVEWYDGELQQAMEDGGRYFYAICVEANFSKPLQDRVYFVINIIAQEKHMIKRFLADADMDGLDRLLRDELYGRRGAIFLGCPNDWRVESADFSIESAPYLKFFALPVVDALAA